jgi:hypothetical protein
MALELGEHEYDASQVDVRLLERSCDGLRLRAARLPSRSDGSTGTL